MKLIGLVLAATVVGIAGSARPAECTATDAAALAGDEIELSLARWHDASDRSGELLAAEQILLDQRRSARADPLARTAFDLAMIRRRLETWSDAKH